MKNKIVKLPGGAVMLYKRRTINNGVVFELTYKVGTANTAYQPGILHFGEHLRAKHTATKSMKECDAFTTSNNISLNASTGLDSLSFYAYASKRKSKEALTMLTEKMVQPVLSDEVFENERKVILNEIDKTKDDDNRNIYIGTMQTAVSNPYYFCNNIGEHSDLLSYDQETVQTHIGNIINSHNLVACVAGRISKSKAKRYIKRIVLPSIQKTEPSVYALESEYAFLPNSNLTFNTNSNVTSHVSICFPYTFTGKNFGYAERVAFGDFVTELLNTRSGLLHQTLRVDNGLVYSAYASIYTNKNKMMLVINFKTNTPSVNKSLAVLAQNLKNLTLTPEKMKEIKTKEQLQKDQSHPRRVQDSSSALYRQYNLYEKFISKRTYRKTYDKMKESFVNDLMAKLFHNNNVYIHIFGNATPNDVYDITTIHNMFFNGVFPNQTQANKTKETETETKTATNDTKPVIV